MATVNAASIQNRVELAPFDVKALASSKADLIESRQVHDIAGIVGQLNQLLIHANTIFSRTQVELEKSNRRIENLSLRSNAVRQFLPSLEQYVDSTAGTVFLQWAGTKYRSKPLSEQQLLLPQTRPNSLISRYVKCKLPPKLEILNDLRKDGKNALKEYTNPDFFIEEWVKQQQADRIKAEKNRKHRRGGAKVQQSTIRPQNEVVVETLKRKKWNEWGEIIEDETSGTLNGNATLNKSRVATRSAAVKIETSAASISVQEPAKTGAGSAYGTAKTTTATTATTTTTSTAAPRKTASKSKIARKEKKKSSMSRKNEEMKSSTGAPVDSGPPIDEPPKPLQFSIPTTKVPEPQEPAFGGPPAPVGGPPAPIMGGPPAPIMGGPPAPTSSGPPAPKIGGPPPPSGGGPPAPKMGGPPPPSGGGPPAPATGGPPPPVSGGPPAAFGGPPPPSGSAPTNIPALPDTEAKSGLLQQISKGIKLRKVEENTGGGNKQPAEEDNGSINVAKILQRRIAMEFSDSEEEGDSDWASEWDD